MLQVDILYLHNAAESGEALGETVLMRRLADAFGWLESARTAGRIQVPILACQGCATLYSCGKAHVGENLYNLMVCSCIVACAGIWHGYLGLLQEAAGQRRPPAAADREAGTGGCRPRPWVQVRTRVLQPLTLKLTLLFTAHELGARKGAYNVCFE